MEEIQVEITPTKHSCKNGYDLMVRTGSHGWAKTDLTIEQLARVHAVIGKFLDDNDYEEEK